VGGWLTGGVGGRRAACARLAGGEQAGWLARTADARLAGVEQRRASGGQASAAPAARHAWVRITALEAWPAHTPVARQPSVAGRRWLSQGLLQYW
jgi:hypothetical protein